MSNCANRDVCQLNHCPAIFEFLKFNQIFIRFILSDNKRNKTDIYKYLFFNENTILRKSLRILEKILELFLRGTVVLLCFLAS